jgi:hypothetical protein
VTDLASTTCKGIVFIGLQQAVPGGNVGVMALSTIKRRTRLSQMKGSEPGVISIMTIKALAGNLGRQERNVHAVVRIMTSEAITLLHW